MIDDMLDKEVYDIRGNRLSAGDFMFEIVGSGSSDGDGFTSISFYEMPKHPVGQGIKYEYNGSKYEFYHANYEKSFRLDKLKHEFLYENFLIGFDQVHSEYKPERNWFLNPKELTDLDIEMLLHERFRFL